jgi:D-beta-D-heptose 7-phosphate kinase/D-beta-D-heptose 1-phosphate adenosyltransferase
VRRLKGPNRPINGQMARAAVLASLGTVDAVVVFDEDTPMHLIETIQPDVLVKGADYREDQVVGADFVKSYGGRIVLARLATEHSTSKTIDRIKG